MNKDSALAYKLDSCWSFVVCGEPRGLGITETDSYLQKRKKDLSVCGFCLFACLLACLFLSLQLAAQLSKQLVPGQTAGVGQFASFWLSSPSAITLPSPGFISGLILNVLL